MTEHGILFSAPMVRALLAGTKTQTRRIVQVEADNPLVWSGWPCTEAPPAPTGFRRVCYPPEVSHG